MVADRRAVGRRALRHARRAPVPRSRPGPGPRQAGARPAGQLLFKLDLVELDPAAEGEVHGPLDFAPEPGGLARTLFDDAVIDAHLDHLAAAQHDDGGWRVNWFAWSPDAEREWSGYRTVEALRILRAYGRL